MIWIPDKSKVDLFSIGLSFEWSDWIYHSKTRPWSGFWVAGKNWTENAQKILSQTNVHFCNGPIIWKLNKIGTSFLMPGFQIITVYATFFVSIELVVEVLKEKYPGRKLT